MKSRYVDNDKKEEECWSSTSENWHLLTKDLTDGKNSKSIQKTETQAVEIYDNIWSESQYEESLQLYNEMMDCKDESISDKIKSALHCLDASYRLFGPESTFASFNGGKDAVVITHLMRAYHAHYYSSQEEPKMQRPSVIYFENELEFPQVRSFVIDTVHRYDFQMTAFDPSHSFTSGLQYLVDVHRPKTLAFVLGTRTNDPNAGKQGNFAPSSHYMPPFMRVNPVIDWSYGDVWRFLRLFHLPYCSLYDEGYTSLGNIHDTLPCPELKEAEGDGYRPAYMLQNWEKERAGRIPSKPKPNPSLSSSLSTVSISDTQDENITEKSQQVTLVGLLIIGDELMKGLVPDINTYHAAQALRTPATRLKRVVVVPDDSPSIVREISDMKRYVDVIVTSGGVGPTHDDITIKSIGKAFNWDMAVHQPMRELILKKMTHDGKENLTQAKMEVLDKMATLPTGCTLEYYDNNDWPILKCHNIYILPGVPKFFKTKIESIAKYLLQLRGNHTLTGTIPELPFQQHHRCQVCKVILNIDEIYIVTALNDVVRTHPHVSFGSYPFVDHQEFKTVLTLEGLKTNQMSQSYTQDQIESHVKLALADLLLKLPEGSIVRVEENDKLVPSS